MTDTSLDTLIFRTSTGTVSLYAYGDCCSRSWFEFICGTRDRFNELAKTHNYLTYKLDRTSNVDLPESGIQDYDQNDRLTIYFTKDLTQDTVMEYDSKRLTDNKAFNDSIENTIPFEMYFRNSSNGYYSGSIEITYKNQTQTANLKKRQLIVIVGLPGSGKTTFAKSLQRDIRNTVLYDDFQLDDNYRAIFNDLKNGKRVILTSVLFCNPQLYVKFIKDMGLTNCEEGIITYKFAIDTEACLRNINKRETDVKQIRRLTYDINAFSRYPVVYDNLYHNLNYLTPYNSV